MDGGEKNNQTQIKRSEFYGEHLQDQWLVEHVFKGKRDGRFLECGALDGLLHSNSLHFERELGWSGILIEANPFVLGALSQNRPHSVVMGCALSDHLGIAEFEVFSGSIYGWSGLTEKFDPRRREVFDTQVPPTRRHHVSVQTRTLISVLRECGVKHLDFLSLDVEGAELSVLEGYPFDDVPIDVIAVEDNFQTGELAPLLTSQGYKHLARVGNDDIWSRL